MGCKWIESNNNLIKSTELLYRLNRDGDTPQAFHSKFDGKGKTIHLLKIILTVIVSEDSQLFLGKEIIYINQIHKLLFFH